MLTSPSNIEFVTFMSQKVLFYNSLYQQKKKKENPKLAMLFRFRDLFYNGII